ncbi:MAG: site-specific integrase [Acidobacteriota bacterium]|nr:site-specific integrase [Acidobacteriota bacterium]
MANFTLTARINAGDGKFPFVNVQFSKNHRPIPIKGATYYLRPSSSGKRTPIKIGKDVAEAHTALIRMEDGKSANNLATLHAEPQSVHPMTAPRKRVAEAAREYIERSKQKSRKTYLGYRTAVNLFVTNCKKTYFDQICRDDMLDFLHELRTRPSRETGKPIGESTVFNYFLKTMVFLNDRSIGKYVAREDWVQKKDWPINVDKRNKNKKYATYTEQELAAMIQVANRIEETLARFLVGTGFRIGEAAVAEWMDINWEDQTVSVRFKPKFGFKPKDYEERTIAVSDTLLACLKKYRGNAPNDVLIFPSPTAQSVDKHLDRIINGLIDRANNASYPVKKPKKPCHAFRVLYATRRHQYGVDIETLRQDLGHSDITTTQIYLRSANTKSDRHRARINEADRFSIVPTREPVLHRAVTEPSPS